MSNQRFSHRYVATVCIEADTPLSLGSGREGIITDRLIVRDANGLPFIPGTSIAGVLRHEVAALKGKEAANDLFGFAQDDNGTGSRLITSAAHMVMDNYIVADGLVQVPEDILTTYRLLPARDHVRINHRGAAEQGGKFEEELVYKGTRFVFSLELVGAEEDEAKWQNLLTLIHQPYFRLGGGTRKGFGALKVITLSSDTFDLWHTSQLKAYLQKSSQLQYPDSGKSNSNDILWKGRYVHYRLEVQARDFFIFGGLEVRSDEADDVYKTEQYIEWKDGKAQLSEKQILIPASSVKGAISHRVAFHYNQQVLKKNGSQSVKDIFEQLQTLADIPEDTLADSPLWQERLDNLESLAFTDDILLEVGEKNKAVNMLFGFAVDTKRNRNYEKGRRGRVLFSDVYLSGAQEKVFDHVMIDRFTGGARDSALFQEKTVTTKETFALHFYVEQEAFDEEPEIRDAWEAALKDIAQGQLPLGGKTTKGHGFFTGKLFKENECIH